jgi:hypothetical protein
MKKVKFQTKKLNLGKQTIANMDVSEMNKHLGGNQPEAKGTPFSKKCRPSW